MTEFIKIPPPERRRQPDYYSADELQQILVDDAVRFRPLGGPGVKGTQWFADAIAKIAAVRRVDQEVVWTGILDEVYAKTGRRGVSVG